MRARLMGMGVGLAVALPAGTAMAAAPVMPLKDVRAGMKCTAYSVFKGQAIEPFDVDVLDVVGQASNGESAPRILIRVSGERVKDTGVGPGFSGSPIFCPTADGTLANAGAISETIGEYGGFTVLATPIEQILATPVTAPTAKTRLSPRDRWILRNAKPISSPLTLGGVNRTVMRGLQSRASKRGVTVLAAPSVPSDSSPVLPFQPGSAVSVGLSSGDLSIAGIGTVSYVDGPDVWAYGHQFDGIGARDLILQDAYVASIINNPVQVEGYSTYKLSGPIHDRGTLSDDGFNAVVGSEGALPPLTTVRVQAHDADRDLDRDMTVDVADETDVGNPAGVSPLSYVGPLAVLSGATDVMGAGPQTVAGSMCMEVKLRELNKPLRFCNRYVNDGVTNGETIGTNPLAQSAGLDASLALAPFDLYKGKPVHIQSATAQIEQTRAQRQAYLRRLVLPRRVRRGSTVPFKLVVQVVRGPEKTITGRWHVPRKLDKGKRRIQVRGVDPDSGGGGAFDEIIIDLSGEESYYDSEGPRTLRQLVDGFKAMKRWDGLRVKGAGRFYRDDTYRIGGRAFAKVKVVRVILAERVEQLLDAHEAEVHAAPVARDERVEALEPRAGGGAARHGLLRAGRADAHDRPLVGLATQQRGALGEGERALLLVDEDDDVVQRVGEEGVGELVQRAAPRQRGLRLDEVGDGLGGLDRGRGAADGVGDGVGERGHRGGGRPEQRALAERRCPCGAARTARGGPAMPSAITVAPVRSASETSASTTAPLAVVAVDARHELPADADEVGPQVEHVPERRVARARLVDADGGAGVARALERVGDPARVARRRGGHHASSLPAASSVSRHLRRAQAGGGDGDGQPRAGGQPLALGQGAGHERRLGARSTRRMHRARPVGGRAGVVGVDRPAAPRRRRRRRA